MMMGKDLLESLTQGANAFLSKLAEMVLGPRAGVPLLGPITWGDVAAFLFILLLLAIAHSVAALYIRQKARQQNSETPTGQRWRSRIFSAISKPLYLLIWICGSYFAFTPIASKLLSREAAPPAWRVFDAAFDFGIFFVVVWFFLRLIQVAETWLRELAAKSENKWDDIFVPLLGKTVRVLLPVVAIILALPIIGLPPAYDGVIAKCSSLLIVGTVSWILFQTVAAVERLVLSRYNMAAADNLRARKVHTQVRVITKTVYVIIGIFSVASALMLFDEVRRFGTSILASAGVIGIIAGFAAQRTMANLFAGFQLAMTQPIRLDDVVIVEGEWGRIEEITLTYVTIHIWDDRRLVVPLSYFIEKPFQNWTRVSANLLGSVFFWADYTLPVQDIRAKVQAIVESCKDWDRRFWNFQVTDTTERAIQVRVLATAADSGKAWNLRCEIREKVIALLQERYSQNLPHYRARFSGNHVQGAFLRENQNLG
jgi:small-conductance mechanosensitive channel